MSLYNISSKESRSYHYLSDWIGDNGFKINSNNKFYNTTIAQQFPFDDHYIILNPSTIRIPPDKIFAEAQLISSNNSYSDNSSSAADPLANFTYSYYDKIYLAKYWKVINN